MKPCFLPVPTNKAIRGTSLVVQWLRLSASMAGDTGSISGQGTNIPYAVPPEKKKKKRKKKVRVSNRDVTVIYESTFSKSDSEPLVYKL